MSGFDQRIKFNQMRKLKKLGENMMAFPRPRPPMRVTIFGLSFGGSCDSKARSSLV